MSGFDAADATGAASIRESDSLTFCSDAFCLLFVIYVVYLYTCYALLSISIFFFFFSRFQQWKKSNENTTQTTLLFLHIYFFFFFENGIELKLEEWKHKNGKLSGTRQYKLCSVRSFFFLFLLFYFSSAFISDRKRCGCLSFFFRLICRLVSVYRVYKLRCWSVMNEKPHDVTHSIATQFTFQRFGWSACLARL